MPLPVQLRYADLKAARIVRNHAGLKNLIETQGFPPGRWLGPNSHIWDEDEVQAWLASRPKERPPLFFRDAEPAPLRWAAQRKSAKTAKRVRR